MKTTKLHKIFICTLFVALVLAGGLHLSGQTPTPLTPAQDAKADEIDRVYNEGRKLARQDTTASIRAAIAKFVQAGEMSKEAGFKFAEVYCFIAAGQGSNQIGELKKALEYFLRAREVRQSEDQRIEANLSLEIALIYVRLGDHVKALNDLNNELEIRKQLKDASGVIGVLHNKAMIYTELGDLAQAKGIYDLILVREKAGDGDMRAQAATTNNLAYVYYLMENYRKAAELYQRAYDIGFKEKLDDIKAPTQIGLGDAFHKLKDQRKSIEHYNRGLALSRKVRNRIFEADALYGLGTVYQLLGDKQRAREFYDQALSIQMAIGAKELEGKTLGAEMSLCRELGQPQMAILYGKRAINLFQSMRSKIKVLTKEIQRLYLKSKEQTYRDLSNILISVGRLPEAQAVLDMLKDQEFEQFNPLRSGESADTVPYSRAETDAIDKIENLAVLEGRQNELEKLQSEKGKLSGEEQAELSRVFEDIEAANKAFRLALDSLAKTEASVEEKISDIRSEKNLQRALGQLRNDLNTGVVAIYTVIGSEALKDSTGKSKTRAKFGWAILVTPEGRKAFPIDVTNLEENVQQFRAALSSTTYNPQPLAQKLYTAIFRQTSLKQKTTLESDLAVIMDRYTDRTIMWSLDGVLRYVPMSALHDGKGYLVEKYRNTVFTNQSLLLLNEKDAAKWETLGLGVSEEKTIDNKHFDALDGTKRELQDIVRQPNEKTGIFDGTRVVNADFTKANAIRLWRERKYQAIHIASHFSFNPLDQNASFLVVGDGKLTFADIQDKDNLFGSVDLLTLSACDTAMSSNGKESEGFPFLAQSLGAKTVIASLWKVSDLGTPELMIRFYKLRSENPQMAKGEAFRRAQLSLLSGEAKAGSASKASKSGTVGRRSDPIDLDGSQANLPLYVTDPAKPLSHPHYWASFVLIGNWR